MHLLLLSRIGNIRKFILQSVTEVIFGKSDCAGERSIQEEAETLVSYIVCFHIIFYARQAHFLTNHSDKAMNNGQPQFGVLVENCGGEVPQRKGEDEGGWWCGEI